jgi:hypothetical protein
MMKNRTTRKLQLHRDTVRALDRATLPRIAGGGDVLAPSGDPLCSIDCPASQLIRCRR